MSKPVPKSVGYVILLVLGGFLSLGLWTYYRAGGAEGLQLHEAAQTGNPAAENRLGDAYHTGQGVLMDDAKAVIWWQAAAEQSNGDGAYSLAMAYMQGLGGLPKDPVQAYKWLMISEAMGNMKGDGALQTLHQSMTPQQHDEAMRLIHEWRPRYVRRP